MGFEEALNAAKKKCLRTVDRKRTMTREEAAEHALRSIELEREAVRHCNSLSNLEYVELMRLSRAEKFIAEQFAENHTVSDYR